MRVPLSIPFVTDVERARVADALSRAQLSRGQDVEEFERTFALAVSRRSGVRCHATSSGTSALHALVATVGLEASAFGGERPDTVGCPAMTYGATLNAITAAGLKAQLFDIDPSTWGISLDDVRRRIGPAMRSIVNVHLYGVMNDVDFGSVVDVPVIEDAAEALFAISQYGNRPGDNSHGAAFSFYGNKVISTGEGGAVLTRHADVLASVRRFCGQGQGERRYYHESHGMNYRMGELQGAVGVAQMANRHEILGQRREGWRAYVEMLPQIGVGARPVPPEAIPSPWLMVGVLGDYAPSVDVVMARMAERGVETRRMFCPLHLLPSFRSGGHWAVGKYPVAEWLYEKAIVLPLFAGMERGSVEYVVSSLKESL